MRLSKLSTMGNEGYKNCPLTLSDKEPKGFYGSRSTVVRDKPFGGDGRAGWGLEN